jgi:hypothetical protein
MKRGNKIHAFAKLIPEISVNVSGKSQECNFFVYSAESLKRPERRPHKVFLECALGESVK